LAVRAGWLPCYPQFTKNNFEVINDAQAAGAKTDEEIVAQVVKELKSRKLKFAMEDPDNPECFPRVFYIWRGNALMSSAKGHEYFLKHYLGTHHNAVSEECAKDEVKGAGRDRWCPG
jgi:nitrate reductase alpha subunit